MALLISESSDSDADDFTVGMTVRVTDENVRQVNECLFGDTRSAQKINSTVFIMSHFLVGDTQLYKRLCPSVRGHESKSAKMSVLDGSLCM